MSAPKIAACAHCGHAALRKWRRCPKCLAFAPEQRGAVEQELARARAPEIEPRSNVAAPLSTIEATSEALRSTGRREVDRVIGQTADGACGVAAGQSIVLGGEPGTGKSTLLLEALAGLCRDGGRVLYASGEESREQIAARARRLGLHDALHSIDVLATHELEPLERALAAAPYTAVVVDSLQALVAEDISSDAGGVRQVKALAERLTARAKAMGFSLWLVGQATKDGRLAGPLAAAHAVDTVLWFESDESGAYRVLRATKNRYGPVGALALLEMREGGLVEVADPSALLVGLAATRERPPGAAWALVAEHTRPLVLEALALVTASKGEAQARLASGIDPKRLALLLAVLERRAELSIGGDVYLDLRGGMRVSDRALDLPVALALASAARGMAVPAGLASCGEIALTGEIRAVSRIQARVGEAARLGFTHVLVPAEQVGLIDTSTGAHGAISIEPVETLADAIAVVESGG